MQIHAYLYKVSNSKVRNWLIFKHEFLKFYKKLAAILTLLTENDGFAAICFALNSNHLSTLDWGAVSVHHLLTTNRKSNVIARILF